MRAGSKGGTAKGFAWLALLVGLAGCGRIGFRAEAAPVDAGPFFDVSPPDVGVLDAEESADAPALEGGLDAGRESAVPVPDGCVVAVELCNEADDDCDGNVDEDFDTTTDPSACGGCGNYCPSGSACVASGCRPSVEGGIEHACAVRSDGTAACWGSNASLALGFADVSPSGSARALPGAIGVRQVATGERHTCVLLDTGTVRCVGTNGAGQLGNGSTVASATLVDVSALTDVRAISAGYTHTCAVLADGRGSCWGTNADGQLGDGSTTRRTSPTLVPGLTDARSVAAGDKHTCWLRASGRVSCVGANGAGQLGLGVGPDRTSVVEVPTLTNITSISAGGDTTCALRRDGTMACWGDSSSGQGGIGAGSTSIFTPVTPVYMGTPMGSVIAFDVGPRHVCAARTVTPFTLCWGGGFEGQLTGVPNFNSAFPLPAHADKRFDALALGLDYACGREGTNVYCWGRSDLGQLGDGLVSSVTAPVTVIGVTGATEVGVGVGSSYAVAAGQVRVWGRNLHGQLGVGGSDRTTVPMVRTTATITDAVEVGGGVFSACALRAAGTVSCWGYGNDGQRGDMDSAQIRATPSFVSGLTDATALSVGGSHACALRSGGGVVCWGENDYGEVGDGTMVDRNMPMPVDLGAGAALPVTTIAAGGDHSCARLSDGEVRCWGRNRDGQLGDGTTTSSATPVVVAGAPSGITRLCAGSSFTCAATGGGDLYCWGGNDVGQLGDGSTTTRRTPSASPTLTGVDRITCGANHSCALSGGVARCAGGNGRGQLGDGTRLDRSSFVNVPGYSDLISIAADRDHTCAVRAGGNVICWGDGHTGKLGNEMGGLRATLVAVIGVN